MPKLPDIPHLNAVRAFEKAGFKVVRQGKHIVMSRTPDPHHSQAQSSQRVHDGRVGARCRALEECEQALGGLITILESKQQLTGTEHRYSGAAFDANWSKCRVSQTRSRTRQYAVYRSNDDVTVVIEKRISAETSELYGPFKSAYRK